MIACSVCSKRDGTFFKVLRVAPDGTESPLTTTCSVKCLLTWGYSYATLQGTRMVWTAREAVRKFFDPKG